MKKIRLLFLTLVALIGAVSASASKTVYIQPNGWTADNAKLSLWIWQDGSDGSWATLNEGAGGCLTATFDDNINRMIFVRGSAANDWDAKYNQTANIDLSTATSDFFYMERVDNNINVGNGITNAYVVNFNTAITTSNHDFKVASNWKHIVHRYTDSYGYDFWMSYTYGAETGIDNSGALYAGQQNAGDNESSQITHDMLVTPVVSGKITIYAKKSSYASGPFVQFWSLNNDATAKNEQLYEVTTLSSDEWTAVTYNVETPQRIGIRAQYVYLDNFSADNAQIEIEKSIAIASADPTATTGTIYWEQQANSKVLVKYTVTVTNNGEAALTQGTENFSVSVFNRKTGEVYFTVPVPQDLAIGETSNPFEVSGEVETTLWPNSSTYINMDLKENLQGSTVQRAQSNYTAYEPKFVFRESGSTSTSSIAAAESWGTIMAEKTKNFEIANTGTAPLTIKSVTLPDGFTSDNAPATEFVLAKGETQALNITQNASVQGTFAGTLSIVYLDKNGAELTYNLAFSTTVIGANTWTADFNNTTSSTALFPVGSIKEGGITTDWDNKTGDGKYNIYLKGSNSTENNKFITPKLHANAGDKLAFDVKAGYSSSDAFFVKVYKSTDRKTWGEPVETYVYSTTGSSFTTKTISFDAAGDYYVAFAIYGTGSGIDNLVGLEKVDVAHDLYIKSVSWPDASIKSGTAQSKPIVDIIPLTNETADNYTVKYIYGETEVAIASKALDASASSTTSFSASFTPEVAKTTTFPGTKVVFEFTDGTKFETETFDLTVTNEPIFHFQNTKYTSRWYEPSSDYTTPYNFGKTNSADSKSFWILNWGSAPLTVKSIAVPEGFTASVASMNLPAFDGTQDGLETCQQSFDVTFTAESAGIYSGNLVVTYVNAAGEDATFELPISGTKLDPTKWYANFGGESNQWPAGSVYQDNVSTTYVAAGDYAITVQSSTASMFVTPKLKAEDNGNISFDAKLYSNSWKNGKVVVYAASTRDEVLNAEEGTTRQQLFSVSGLDAESPMTTDFQTFTVQVPAGEWYLGFDISGRPYVDELYGLKLADVAHDLQIASSNIPTEGMQNYNSTASVNVRNFGLATDKVTVTAYVNGVAVATSAEAEVAMNHKLNDAGTEVSVTYMSNVAGTFPVYLEVKAGDYSIATDPVGVTFAAEEAKSEADMATNGTAGDSPINLNYHNSESVTMYNAEALAAVGISGGTKIKKITYKGYKTSDEQTTSFQIYYKWTDDQTLAQPETTYPYAAEDNGMTKLIDEDHTWAKVGSSSELGEMIVLDFSSNPLTYEEGKSLVIYMHSYVNSYKAAYFEKSTLSTDYCYERQQDNPNITNKWNKKNPAALHFTLDASVATLSGIVKNSAGAGIGGATVTLKAENGVQYSATADESGVYTMNVIQAGLDFTATVEKDGYLKNEFAYSLGGESKTLDVTMYKTFGIVGSMPGLDWNNDQVMTQSTENPNIFTLELNNVEVSAGTYAFKLRADGQWGTYELPAEGGNYTDGKNGYAVVGGNYQWEIKTAGTYNFKFTFDWATHTLTFERPYTLSDGVQELNWVDITIDREFKAGWNAIVLPFDMSAEEVKASFGESAEVAYFAGDENNGGDITVKFNKRPEGSIEAGVPYLVWSEAAVSGLKFTKDVTATQHNTTGTNFDFVGVYTTTTTSEGDYFMQGGEFKKTGNDNTVLPFRAYLKLKAPAASVRSVNVVFGEDGMPTSIDALQIDGLNGAEGAYNLSGQKVHNLQKGRLYIVNGKKVIKK